MKFILFAETASKLEATSGRLDMVEILSQLFKEAGAKNIDTLILLLQGKVAPPFEGLEVGMGEKFVEKAIASATGYTVDQVHMAYRKTGDLGKACEQLLSKKKQMSLSSEELIMEDVFNSFLRISKISGSGSQDMKIKMLAEMLNRATPLEGRYLVRIPLANLQLGVGDPTIMDALSKAKKGDNSLREPLEREYNLCSDLGAVAKRLYEGKRAKTLITVFNPIRPALAERENDPEAVLERHGTTVADLKLDGFRCVSGYTPIYVEGKGVQAMRDLRVGDRVLTRRGTYSGVIAKHSRTIRKGESLYKIQSYFGQDFKVTGDHLILVEKNGKRFWLPVAELTRDYYLVFPIPHLKTSRKNAKVLRLEQEGYVKEIVMDNDFYRFIGFWIGDGFENEFHHTERIGLHFNGATERRLSKEYGDIIRRVFGIKNISKYEHSGVLTLYWRDKPFRKWLTENFRHEWKTKRDRCWKGKSLPEWFAGISISQFKHFLKGWFEADGCTDNRGKYIITTKERDLAAFAQLIGISKGMFIGFANHRVKSPVRKTYYRLVIPIFEKQFFKRRKDALLIKPFRIERIRRDPRMRLYDIQVNGSESFCVPLATLHNCQIHKKGNQVMVFSRRLENMTAAFPEVVETIKNSVKAKEAIIDSEALAYNETTGELYPFQYTIQRKRKHDVKEKSEEMPLHVFAFDLIYLDGKDMTEKPYHERRKTLERIIKPDGISLVESITTDNLKELKRYFTKAIERGCEGLVCKDPNSPYKAGSRGFNWIKLKRSYRGELADTIDIVIVGYYLGKGSRAEFKFGGLLGAVYDEDSDTFKTVTRVGTGFSEEMMKKLEKTLDPIVVKTKPARVDAVVEPDFWVKPIYVITVKADEITESPMHTAGRKGETGYALRFPRMIGDIREDKAPEDATSVAELIRMFKLQKHIAFSGSEEK